MDIKFIRDNQKLVKDSLKKRNLDINLDDFLKLDTKRVSLIEKVQILREERNNVGRQNTPESHKRGSRIKEELKIIEPELQTVETEFGNFISKIPNLVHPQAPSGNKEENNKTIRTWGKKPDFNFKPLDHLTLGKKLDLIDFERGIKVVGADNYFFKNEMVILEQALINYALEFVKNKGFILFSTPDLAKLKIIEGIGFSPRGPEKQIYLLEDTDLGLIATSEITLGGYYQGEILDIGSLPLKLAGFSHCFRTEAGSYGRESRGLYRVHQFSKVEMFIYCLPEESDKMHQYLVNLEEECTKNLEIPYRVVDICGGDLGAPAYRKYDLEAWMPGLEKWGEITSASNCTDYQSQRLRIKYRSKNNQTNYVHTLNGTAITTSRIPIAILENFQCQDGSVKIPEALHKYTGFTKILAK